MEGIVSMLGELRPTKEWAHYIHVTLKINLVYFKLPCIGFGFNHEPASE